ncbi:MAG: hypothetical protein EB114_04680 [Betaproteobacteria bacterium]|nr:hypothetical protein [Betaproteobacteria bacterium]NCX43652.1 hypothetical protein [Betaproteobacteria bacterium]NDA21204.1 hypothetical protein [Betaproteobacteria bacterium]NDF73460.1 hypothetical protein [Betaproteobacteria bacterium]
MTALADPHSALLACQSLLALALILFSFEDRKLIKDTLAEPCFAWHVLGHDLKALWPRSFRLLAWCFDPQRLNRLLLLRTLCALLMLGGIANDGLRACSLLMLWVSQVLMMVRWRGALNGGSDIMTLSLLNALMIGETFNLSAQLFDRLESDLGHRISLWFIVIQSLSAYVISGAVKLREKAWRDGRALIHFLNHAIYGPLQPRSLFRRRSVSMAVSWSFILWECSMPCLLLHPQVAIVACAIALVFHGLVFWFFGLNRFFWTWISCLPALMFASYAMSPLSV